MAHYDCFAFIFNFIISNIKHVRIKTSYNYSLLLKAGPGAAVEHTACSQQVPGSSRGLPALDRRG